MAKDLSVDFVVRNNIITVEINYQTKLKFIARKVEEKIYAKIGRKIDLNFILAHHKEIELVKHLKLRKLQNQTKLLI